MVKLSDIFNVMEEIAPEALAEDWDNVGLQTGSYEDEAKGIMVALDPSVNAIEHAIKKGFNLLLTHHPLFLSDIKSIDSNTPLGKAAESAIRGSLTVFTAHTNLDSVQGGVSDMLAELLGVEGTVPIEQKHLVGHNRCGLGRIGRAAKQMRLRESVAELKKKLKVTRVRVLGDMDRKIETIALCGGSGGNLVALASRMGADLFISGDIRYHQAREAQELGLSVIDIGHFSSERIVIEGLTGLLSIKLEARGYNIPMGKFDREKEPFIII